MRPITAAACLLTVTGSAIAQSGVATYSIAFGSPNGPNSVVLSPGQSTDVFVNVAFKPGVGGGSPAAAGLSDGAFSITGTGDGTGTWSIDGQSTSPTYALPIPWGGQLGGAQPVVNAGTRSALGVTGVIWGYGFLPSVPHPYPQNPANIWRATFTASAPGLINASFTNVAPTGVFAAATGQPTVVFYDSQALTGQISIVPAPACGAVLALASLLATRRRRVRSCP